MPSDWAEFYTNTFDYYRKVETTDSEFYTLMVEGVPCYVGNLDVEEAVVYDRFGNAETYVLFYDQSNAFTPQPGDKVFVNGRMHWIREVRNLSQADLVVKLVIQVADG